MTVQIAWCMQRNLSPREKDVFRLVCQGMTSQQCAAELGISARTVEVHRRSILHAFNATTTAGAVACAVAHGIVAINYVP